MITKTIRPIGEIKRDEHGKTTMCIKKVTAEYRLFGILLYRKVLVTPLDYGTEFWSEFTVDF